MSFLLGLLKYLPATLLPGGWIFASIGAFFSALFRAAAWFIGWLFADIADGFKEPQRFAVRIVCFLIVFGIGGWSGIQWKAEKDAPVIAALTKQRDDATGERDQWRQRHAEQTTRASEAEKARDAAMHKWQTEIDRTAAAPPPAAKPAVVRVRPGPPATPAAAQSGGPGLFGFPALFWGGR